MPRGRPKKAKATIAAEDNDAKQLVREHDSTRQGLAEVDDSGSATSESLRMQTGTTPTPTSEPMITSGDKQGEACALHPLVLLLAHHAHLCT